MRPKIEPKYQTIANILRKRIFIGQYPVNTMLPTESQLQQEFKVGRATIRSAVQLLQREGAVRVHQGRGTLVLERSGLQRFENVISVSESVQDIELIYYDIALIRHLDTEDASFLGIAKNEPVYRIRRLLGHGNSVYAYMINYIPFEIAPHFDQVIAKLDSGHSVIDIYTILNDYYGIRYTNSTETLCGGLADEHISEAMQIAPGTPLIYTRRTASCSTRPMECSYLYHVASKYKLIFKMQRSYIE